MIHWRLQRRFEDVGTLYAGPAQERPRSPPRPKNGSTPSTAFPTARQPSPSTPPWPSESRSSPSEPQTPLGPPKSPGQARSPGKLPWGRSWPTGRSRVGPGRPIGPEPPATAIHGHGAWRAARDTLAYAQRSATIPVGRGDAVHVLAELARTPALVEPLPPERRLAATAAVVSGKDPRLPNPRSVEQARERGVDLKALNDAFGRFSPNCAAGPPPRGKAPNRTPARSPPNTLSPSPANRPADGTLVTESSCSSYNSGHEQNPVSLSVGVLSRSGGGAISDPSHQWLVSPSHVRLTLRPSTSALTQPLHATIETGREVVDQCRRPRRAVISIHVVPVPCERVVVGIESAWGRRRGNNPAKSASILLRVSPLSCFGTLWRACDLH